MNNSQYFKDLNGLLTSIKSGSISKLAFRSGIEQLNQEALESSLSIQLVDADSELIRAGHTVEANVFDHGYEDADVEDEDEEDEDEEDEDYEEEYEESSYEEEYEESSYEEEEEDQSNDEDED